MLGKEYPGTEIRTCLEHLWKRSDCLHKFSSGFWEFSDMSESILQYNPDEKSHTFVSEKVGKYSNKFLRAAKSTHLNCNIKMI